MKIISFKPEGLEVGQTYRAELVLNGGVVSTINNLANNVIRTFEVTTPGTYVIRVLNNADAECIRSYVVQALFPTYTFSVGEVDCNSNSYNVTITVTNPATAGSNIQYGWSTINDCTVVTNWSSNNSITLGADSIVRYIFIKNNDVECCFGVTSTFKEPCITCALEITNISFSCNG